jgi:hypothetical protein
MILLAYLYDLYESRLYTRPWMDRMPALRVFSIFCGWMLGISLECLCLIRLLGEGPDIFFTMVPFLGLDVLFLIVALLWGLFILCNFLKSVKIFGGDRKFY